MFWNKNKKDPQSPKEEGEIGQQSFFVEQNHEGETSLRQMLNDMTLQEKDVILYQNESEDEKDYELDPDELNLLWNKANYEGLSNLSNRSDVEEGEMVDSQERVSWPPELNTEFFDKNLEDDISLGELTDINNVNNGEMSLREHDVINSFSKTTDFRPLQSNSVDGTNCVLTPNADAVMLRNELSRAVVNLRQAELARRSADEQNQDLIQQLLSLDSANHQLQMQLNNSEEKLVLLQTQSKNQDVLSLQNDRMKLATEELGQAKGKLKEKEQVVAQLRWNAMKYETEIENTKSAFESEVDRLNGDIAQMQILYSAKNRQIEELAEHMGQYEKAIEHLNHAMDEKDRDYHRDIAERDQYESEISEQLTNCQNVIGHLRGQIENLNQKLQNADSLIEEKNRTNETKDVILEDLRGQLENFRRGDLNQIIKKYENEICKIKEEHRNELKMTKDGLLMAKERIKDLENELFIKESQMMERLKDLSRMENLDADFYVSELLAKIADLEEIAKLYENEKDILDMLRMIKKEQANISIETTDAHTVPFIEYMKLLESNKVKVEQLNHIRTDMKALRDEKNMFKSQMMEMQSLIDRYENKLNQHKEQEMDLRREMGEKQTQLNELQKVLEKCSEESVRIQSHFTKIESHCNALKQENEVHKADNENAHKASEILKLEINNILRDKEITLISCKNDTEKKLKSLQVEYEEKIQQLQTELLIKSTDSNAYREAERQLKPLDDEERTNGNFRGYGDERAHYLSQIQGLKHETTVQQDLLIKMQEEIASFRSQMEALRLQTEAKMQSQFEIKALEWKDAKTRLEELHRKQIESIRKEAEDALIKEHAKRELEIKNLSMKVKHHCKKSYEDSLQNLKQDFAAYEKRLFDKFVKEKESYALRLASLHQKETENATQELIAELKRFKSAATISTGNGSSSLVNTINALSSTAKHDETTDLQLRYQAIINAERQKYVASLRTLRNEVEESKDQLVKKTKQELEKQKAKLVGDMKLSMKQFSSRCKCGALEDANYNMFIDFDSEKENHVLGVNRI